MPIGPMSCSRSVVYMSLIFSFPSHLQSVLLSALQRQTIEKLFSPCSVVRQVRKLIYFLSVLFVLHLQRKVLKQRKQTSLVYLPACCNISSDPALCDKDKVSPVQQCGRWGKLIGKIDATDTSSCLFSSLGFPSRRRDLKKSLPIISTS